MRRRAILAFLLSIVVIFPSCKSVDHKKVMGGAEQKFYSGQYLEAARLLLPHVNSSSSDKLLYMMECGYMLHAGQDYNKSNGVLLEAAKLAPLVPISITQQVSSLLTNDSGTNYRGEDFEKVLVHMYLGLNFVMLKKYNEARVEFKLVNEQLSKIKNEDGKPQYKQNIMAKYLTALAYEVVGDRSNDKEDTEFAYIELKQVQQLMPNLDMVYGDLQRLAKKLDYQDDYADLVKKFGKREIAAGDAGEVVLVYQSGRSAVKASRGPLLSDPNLKGSIMISLNTTSLPVGVTVAAVLITLNNAENPIPYFVKRSNRTKFLNLKIDNKLIRTILLEDVENTAIRNLEDSYPSLRTKLAASIVTKAVASLAAAYAAKKVADQFKGTKGFSGLIGMAVGVGTGTALFSSMKPDLRSWHTLPANLQMAKAVIKPGKYRATLEYVAENGFVQRTKQLDLEVAKGEKVFINERTLE